MSAQNAIVKARTIRTEATEAEILHAVLDYLNTIPGVYCWRRNVGGFSATDNGKLRFIKFGMKGQSDIEGIGPRGKHVEVEIKRPGQKPTDVQSDWLFRMRSLDGIAFCCTSVEDCNAWMRAEFIRYDLRWNKLWDI